jgi:hypothetical protein
MREINTHRANTHVSRGEYNGDTSGTQLSIQVAHGEGILLRYALQLVSCNPCPFSYCTYLLILTVGCRNHLGKLGLRKFEYILQEIEVRLVRVVIRIRLVEIRDYGTSSTCAVLRDWEGRG